VCDMDKIPGKWAVKACVSVNCVVVRCKASQVRPVPRLILLLGGGERLRPNEGEKNKPRAKSGFQ
jgi:hypothetical protein